MKIWGWVALAAIVLGALGGGARWAYTSGYDARDQEVQQDIIDAQETARREEEEKWRETVAEAEAQIVVEEKIVESIRVVEKEIPKVVEKIVEVKPECSNLGTDFAGLLNDQVRSANSRESTEASSPLVE